MRACTVESGGGRGGTARGRGTGIREDTSGGGGLYVATERETGKCGERALRCRGERCDFVRLNLHIVLIFKDKINFLSKTGADVLSHTARQMPRDPSRSGVVWDEIISTQGPVYQHIRETSQLSVRMLHKPQTLLISDYQSKTVCGRYGKQKCPHMLALGAYQGKTTR
jgi:hypothetical protein